MDAVLAKLEEISQRLARLEGAGGVAGGAAAPAGGAAAGDGEEAAAVTAFQDLVDEYLVKFASLSEKIGGDVAPLGKLVLECAAQQKALIAVACKSKKPSDAELPALLQPLSKAIMAVGAYKDDNRFSKEKNHLFGVAEAIPIFGWVAVTPTPAPFAKNFIGSGQFYTNKILKEFKGKDEDQVEWAKSLIGFLNALVDYIKKVHTTGLAWNPRGGKASAPAAAPVAAAAAPKKAAAAPTKTGKGKPAALFAELNKGGAVTGGLKKVARADTNKDKKVSGTVKAKATKAVKLAKPPVCQLNGIKWIVEYQTAQSSPCVIEVQKNHTVYIYRCEGAVIQIQGKVNSICMDNCKKTGLVFGDAVSTVEVVNCQSVQVQTTGVLPAIAIDKSAGVQVFLSKDSLETELITGTSSEMNVVIPGPSEEADPIEMPVPEQFKSQIKDGKLITNQVDHSGG